jgi:hypothetical protein
MNLLGAEDTGRDPEHGTTKEASRSIFRQGREETKKEVCDGRPGDGKLG